MYYRSSTYRYSWYRIVRILSTPMGTTSTFLQEGGGVDCWEAGSVTTTYLGHSSRAAAAWLVGTLPLFKGCQAANPNTTQPTYADDNTCGRKRRDMVPCLQYLHEYGGDYGYYPEEDKSSLVVHPSNVDEKIR